MGRTVSTGRSGHTVCTGLDSECWPSYSPSTYKRSPGCRRPSKCRPGITFFGVDQRVVNFAATDTARARQSLHGRLEIAPHLAFRKGRLVFEGWTIPRLRLRELVKANRPVCADDFQPEFTQKGVDIKIGLDVAWLASMHIVDKIVLVTGDTDFVPATKFARRQGVQVIIATVSADVSSLLRAHSDEHRQIHLGRTF